MSHIEGISSNLIGVKDELIRFWWSMVKLTATSCMSHSCQWYVSETPGRDLITSSTNIRLEHDWLAETCNHNAVILVIRLQEAYLSELNGGVMCLNSTEKTLIG